MEAIQTVNIKGFKVSRINNNNNQNVNSNPK